MKKNDRYCPCFGNTKTTNPKNNLKALYEDMRGDIQKEIKDNQINIDDLRIRMGLPREEFIMFLQVGNYSVYETMITEIQKMKKKKL